jgi:hypothetical protein
MFWVGSRRTSENSILFRSKLTLPEGEGPAADRHFGRERSAAAFTPAVIIFLALPEAEDKTPPG